MMYISYEDGEYVRRNAFSSRGTRRIVMDEKNFLLRVDEESCDDESEFSVKSMEKMRVHEDE